MSRPPKSSEALGIAEAFHAQAENIRHKRSVRICVDDFAPTSTLADICGTLSMILDQHSPPIQLEHIGLAENQLQRLPAEFWLLCSASLRTLDLRLNQLFSVPENLALHCPNLENLDLLNNWITQVEPALFSPLRSLRFLLLRDNRITHVPPALSGISSLQTLVVSGNPLAAPNADAENTTPARSRDPRALVLPSSPPCDQRTEITLDPQASGQPWPMFSPMPSIERTQSLVDTRTRSLKASRRMGLIINSKQITPDKISYSSAGDSGTPSKPPRKLLLPSRENSDLGDASRFLAPETPPLAATFTSALHAESRPGSRPVLSPKMEPAGPSATPGVPGAVLQKPAKDPEHSLDGHAELDPEPVSYFRRLSVLQETPMDGTVVETPPSNNASEDTDLLRHPSAAKNEVPAPKLHPPKRKVSSAQQNLYFGLLPPNAPGLGPTHGTMHEKSVIVKASRKILFSFSELHLSIKRFAGFCGDKKLSLRIVRLVHSSKEHIDDLVRAMEAMEDGEDNHSSVVGSLHACIGSFKTILTAISENFAALVAKIDTCFIRMVLLTLFGSLHELQNAHRLLTNTGNAPRPLPSLTRNASSLMSSLADSKVKHNQAGPTSTGHSLEDLSLETPSIASASEAVATLEEIDERLYQTISSATINAQVVFSELTKTISKSAMASATTGTGAPLGSAVAAKFKELTQVCMTSMEITKRLVAKLAAIRDSPDPASRRSFWDDINLFLKAVILTFSAVKGIMRDAPIFNEVRGSMANLTKTTKELTIILEASSYKAISDAVGSLPNNNTWHMSNGPPAGANGTSSMLQTAGPMSAVSMPLAAGPMSAVRTPLVATVGTTAAQALLPQQDPQHGPGTPSHGKHNLPPLNLPPLVTTESYNGGLHTAPVQSMEQFYAKNVNPFDRI
ncbi:hypothetical protein METBIDRAFT_43937 [Metschnikowia bicuspidata var. bicuspidata NRRL YB-4993]|uniref:L domain-like protein n=1 Tax=Metschnikowia bicuspidata var. bicuspidata NRRL YB-4993 TaxID=869754 RepID=A0A1A0HAA7_9ASCO|nr:hypothetical protein METBIDRAFT_43937 [Metschnikowia bicuspidata var. bicuspidata NRRL YB-4993]OBA20808.1 hypothetical protein METBIDRAFT_43937 [Metschnikowia bicuspidata var. bicuspidata NRRL YB-4993]